MSQKRKEKRKYKDNIKKNSIQLRKALKDGDKRASGKRW